MLCILGEFETLSLLTFLTKIKQNAIKSDAHFSR